MKNYGTLSKPLTKLLKKDGFGWSEPARHSFDQLKEAMVTAPILTLSNFMKEFVIENDACDVGLGAVLMQRGKTITFITKALAKRHLGLSVYEKELLSIVYAVEKWQHYLLGRHFIIRTDHQSLKYLLEQRLHNDSQFHWLSRLIGFDYEIAIRMVGRILWQMHYQECKAMGS